jgi:PAS domain S-box-containing protein
MITGMSEGDSVERHRAVGAIRGELSVKHSASTERLRAVFEELDVGMILKDAEGKPLETNPALRRMLGYGEEELRGMVRSDFTVSEDAERDAELYRQLLAGERDSFRIEKRYVRKDGGIMWGRLSVSRIEGAEGEPAFAVGVVEDITERKEAEEKLRKSEARLVEAQRIAHLGNWEWEVKTGEVFWSDDTFRIYGYEPKEVEPTVDKLMKLVHPDDRELVRK